MHDGGHKIPASFEPPTAPFGRVQRPTGAVGAPNAPLSLREMWAILRRRVRLIGLSVALVFGFALLYLAQATPLFTATALLLVDPGQKNLLQPDQPGVASATLASARIESEVEILRSDTVLLATVRAAGLIEDPEFGPRLSALEKMGQVAGLSSGRPDDPDTLVMQTLDRVRASVMARRKGLTNLIALSFSSEDPMRAASLANIVAETYIALQVRAKSQSFLDARDVLSAQLAAAQDSLAKSDGALSDYIATNIAASGSANVAALQRQLERLNSDREQRQAAADAAAGALAVRDWEGLSSQLRTDAIAALDKQRRAFARRLEAASADSAEAVDLRGGLAQIEAMLAEQSASTLGARRAEIARLDAARAEMRSQIRRELLAGDLPPETLSEIYARQREAAIAQSQYDTLLSRMRDLEAQAAVQVSDSRIVSPAVAPLTPSHPQTQLVLGLALAAALGLGIGLAFLAEFYVGGVHSATQLANVIPGPSGTLIPREHVGSDRLSPADVVLDTPMSRYAESLRRLRAYVDVYVPDTGDGGRVVMVTSAQPAEAKSVVALSLARTYAASGKRVLLIDADMRKPMQHVLMGVEPPSGLFEYLSGADEDGAECYGIDPRAPLGVVFGRHSSDVPTDLLLQSATFRALIEDSRSSFDVIIIDTPPINSMVDTRYIAPLADCTVLCVRSGDTNQQDIRAAFEQVSEVAHAGAPILPALTLHTGAEAGYRYSDYF